VYGRICCKIFEKTDGIGIPAGKTAIRIFCGTGMILAILALLLYIRGNKADEIIGNMNLLFSLFAGLVGNRSD